jgi:hypothetical protein
VPDTFQAVAVLILLVLPGALYTWAFERVVGPWGVGLVDRILRFIGISAGVQVLLAPITYRWYRVYVHSGDLAAGRSLPLEVWFGIILYVFLPITAGYLIGQATKHNVSWIPWIVGKQPAPRAWDELFLQGGNGYVRLRLKSIESGEDRWVAGWFGSARIAGQMRRSRVARYTEAQDLYLVQSFQCDGATGELLLLNGNVITLDEGLLIRWDEVEYLSFEAARGRASSESEAQEEPAQRDADA